MKPDKAVPPIFSAFDKIRIVNLPHRKDRRDEMSEQLARVGLHGDPRVAFYPAVAPNDAGMFHSRGAHGCFLSQVGLLREAADTNSSILILEDDCDFLLAIFDYARPTEWDVFYGGYLESDRPNLHEANISGAHFMGFSARAANAATAYFESYLRPDFKGDPRGTADPGYDPDIRPPIDGGYVWFRRAHPELKTVFAMLSEQRASRSDITVKRFFDHIPVVRDMVEFARRTRRRLRQSDQ